MSQATAAPTAEPLSLWHDTPTRQAILDFVAAVTDPSGPHYVPPAQRIATFDNDGTLWCEKPFPFQLASVVAALAAMAAAHPDLRNQQPYLAAVNQDYAWFGDALLRHYQGDETALQELLGGMLATAKDRPVEEVEAQARAFVMGGRHPTLGRPFSTCIYTPMRQLLDYLTAHEFNTYIVSGGGRDFMRGFATELYGIPRDRVLGTTLGYRSVEDDATVAIVQDARLGLVNDGPGKPVQIWNVIGQRPILAAGNSNGDVPMLKFAGGAALPALRLLVDHDDAAREFAYTAGAEQALSTAAALGWTVVSVKDDWRQVFPA